MFKNVLNDYIDKLRCTSKDIAAYSNISQAVISRYRTGERTPKYGSIQLKSIIDGILEIAKEKNIKLDYKDVEKDFLSVFDKKNVDTDLFRNNLNALIDKLNINASDMAKYIGYDASFISKVRTGVRKPQNVDDFINAICKFIVNNYNDNDSINTLAIILNTDIKNIKDEKMYFDTLKSWFTNNINNNQNEIASFLTKLDEFDLNEYIKSIKFDEIKVPTLPFNLPKTKEYYGLDGFKNSQLDALKSIVLSKSNSDVFFYSNMPMIEASKDIEFTKKFMIGLAFMLKKGLKLNMVHNLDRPFDELLLGLEGWIPLYMTGQIMPYYFKNNSSSLYSHIECVGGSTAMSGNLVMGDMNTASFYLTTKSNEVSVYEKRVKNLLKKASPLIGIYREIDIEKYYLAKKELIGNKKNVLTSLPLYIMDDNLIDKILTDNKIDNHDKMNITKHIKEERSTIINDLKNNTIYDEINICDGEKIYLSVSNFFYNNRIKVSSENYQEFLKQIKTFKTNHKNYNYTINNNSVFKNINISIIAGKTAIISKENAPTIHFIIHHIKLVSAIDNFKVQITEK